MLLYFNNKGQLKEQLEYDSVARAGTTAFKIYAIFENLNPSNVNRVLVKLYKPDLFHSTYPFDIEMNYDDNFYFNSALGESSYLTNGTKYNAYVLDFNEEFQEDEETSLLDMPGLWKVVITIYGNDFNVQGIASLNVQNGIR